MRPALAGARNPVLEVSQNLRYRWFIISLAILLPAVLLFKYPPDAWTPAPAGLSPESSRVNRDYTPGEMLRTPQWFLIYFSFTFAISTILIFAAQMKMIAREFGIPQAHFDLLLILFPLGNGVSRIFGGAVSDRIGRERTIEVLSHPWLLKPPCRK